MTGTVGQYQRHLAQFANGNLGASFTIDLHANGIYQSGVLNSATCAVTFAPPRVHTSLFVELIQDATGGRAVTFASPVVGTVPPLNTTANASTLLELVYNGTSYQFVASPIPLPAPFSATEYVTPGFTGVSNGSQSNPFPSHTAAIAAAPSTGAVLIQAPGSSTVESITLPTTGTWEIRCEHERGAFISGNIVCSGTISGGNGINTIDTMIVTGTVSGTASTGVRYLCIINSSNQGAVNLTAAGGLWTLFANGEGVADSIGQNGGFLSTVSVAGSIEAHAYSFFGAITFTVFSQFVNCRIATSTINIGTGGVRIQNTTFTAAPTFTGAAVVTMDGFSHASAVAAGGITLAGGATLVIQNDVAPSGITPGSNTQVLTTVGGVTAWAAAAASAVTSVFGRVGAVVAVAGDYAASKINNDSATVTGTHVSDALDALKALIAASVTGVSSVYGRTGAVIATAGDYAASKINNDSVTVAGAHVSDALDALKALIASSGVTSWNTRTGGVTPASGDYAASQVTNDSSVIGTGVSGAINTLKAQIAALVASSIGNDSSVTGTTVKDALNSLRTSVLALVTGVSSVFGRTGAIVAVAGDYPASKITNDAASAPGTHVSDALDALLNEYPRGSYSIGGSVTLDLTAIGKLGLVTATSSVNVAIPTGGTIGTKFDVLLYASGSSLSTSANAGVTAHNLTFQANRYAKVTLECIATNEWVISWTDVVAIAQLSSEIAAWSYLGDFSIPLVGLGGVEWNFSVASGWAANGGGDVHANPIGPIPATRDLTSLTVRISPVGGHGALPVQMPTLVVHQVDGFGVVSALGSATDSSASVSAYELPHDIVVSGLSAMGGGGGAKSFFFVLTAENGTNAVNGCSLVGASMNLGT